MKALKLLFRYMKENIFLFLFTILLVILLNYIRSIVPKLTSEFIAIIDPSSSSSSLPGFLKFFYKDVTTIQAKLIVTSMLICFVALIRETINIFCDVNIYKISEVAGCKAQSDYFKKIQNLPYSYLNHAETGDLIQRSTQDISRFKSFITGSLLDLFNSLCKVVIYGISMFLIHPKFSFYALLILPVYFISSYFYFKKQAKDYTLIEKEEGKMTTVLQENLTGIRVVKAFANENYEIQKFNTSLDHYTNVWRRTSLRMSKFWGVSDFLTYCQMITVFALSVYFIYHHEMTLDQVVLMFLYTEAIAWPCRNLGRQLAEFGKTSICCQRIEEILQLKDEYEDEKDGAMMPEITGDIEFKNVSFQFEDASIPTLHDINLTIHKGETIAIIGKTGSGKTTFVNLINRLLDPTSGQIWINQHDITTIEKQYLREKVGLILQEPFLFSKTIEENITIGTKNSTLSEARKLAAIASVDEDIQQFEKKYDTMVGERGVTLSGGQKQRIAIARMLSKKHPILIFDDSLSAVDTETDSKIRKALKEKEKDCTTIIITHRITTAKDASRILVFEDGSITQMGTHDELIVQPGLYQKIWNIQNYFNDHPNAGGDINHV